MATFPLPRLPRPAYLYCNILPVRLYVLGEVLRAGLCAGLRNFAFLTRKCLCFLNIETDCAIM